MNAIDSESDAIMKRNFLNACWQTYGNAAEAAKMTGISYRRQFVWQRDDEEFKKELLEIRELYLDKLEAKMALLTACGDLGIEFKATAFELSKKARHRGYGDKLEVNNTGAPAVVFVAPHQLSPEAWAAETDT